MAGRYIVLCFYGTGADEVGREALAAIQEQHRALFDDDKIALFGVSVDPADEPESRAKRDRCPASATSGISTARSGASTARCPAGRNAGRPQIPIRRFWMVLDPTLRVRAVFPFRPDGSDRAEVMAYLRALPPVGQFAGFEIPAPVLVLPDVFEPEFCRHLIGLYEQHGGEESGFMREVDGKTVAVHDPDHKRRKDYVIEDPELIRQIAGAHPPPHRAGDREGALLQAARAWSATSSPATRPRTAAISAPTATTPPRAPRTAASPSRSTSTPTSRAARSASRNTGRAATRRRPAAPWCSPARCCTRSRRSRSGRRYAFLPFLYDDEAAKIREANNAHLGEGVGAYRA